MGLGNGIEIGEWDCRMELVIVNKDWDFIMDWGIRFANRDWGSIFESGLGLRLEMGISDW